MNETFVTLYVIFAIAGALLLVYVGIQAVNDLHLKRTDHPRVFKARKLVFFGDAVYLTLTICYRDFWLVHPTPLTVALAGIGFVGGGMSLLIVSLVSMHMRAPRNPEQGYRTQSVWAHPIASLSRIIRRH